MGHFYAELSTQGEKWTLPSNSGIVYNRVTYLRQVFSRFGFSLLRIFTLILKLNVSIRASSNVEDFMHIKWHIPRVHFLKKYYQRFT